MTKKTYTVTHAGRSYKVRATNPTQAALIAEAFYIPVRDKDQPVVVTRPFTQAERKAYTPTWGIRP